MSPFPLLLAATAAVLGCKEPVPEVEPAVPGSETSQTLPSERSPSPARPRCAALPFASALELPEASGATWAADTGRVIVVSDSGHHGRFAELDPTTGTLLASGHLPVPRDLSDDLEGLSWYDGRLFALSSAGWLHVFRRGTVEVEGTFVSDGAPYPIADPPHRCAEGKSFNCGPNYEGLCLVPVAQDPAHCAGYAATKTEGSLICLRWSRQGTLAADLSSTITVLPTSTLSGCHFSADGERLVVGANVLGGNSVLRISDWRSPEREISPLGRLGRGSGEAIAVGPTGEIYRLSDVNQPTSLVDRYQCE